MASLTLTLPGVALVTGAAGGIGAAIVKAFVRAGCSRLAITDANSDALEQVHRDILDSAPVSKVVSLSGDLSDEGFVASLADAVHTAFGRVDYVVNVAGVLGGSLRSTETSVEEFDRINRVNYRGTWLSSRAMLSLMLKQEPLPEHGEMRGSVVNIASQLGIVARPGAAPYCASKAAIINLTRSDAIDYSRDGIRVNCVCPGVIATPMTTKTPELVERLRPAVDLAPMKRMGTPDEVAGAVLFLCSPLASFVQGHALVVDGGYTIN